MKTVFAVMVIAVLGIVVCGCMPKKEQGAAQASAAAEKTAEKAVTNVPAPAATE